jgi:hypothetical protein
MWQRRRRLVQVQTATGAVSVSASSGRMSVIVAIVSTWSVGICARRALQRSSPIQRP